MNNLISNAIKFTGEGGTITLTLKSEYNSAAALVKDMGCGISEELMAKIFDKFYQGDTSHSSKEQRFEAYACHTGYCSDWR